MKPPRLNLATPRVTLEVRITDPARCRRYIRRCAEWLEASPPAKGVSRPPKPNRVA